MRKINGDFFNLNNRDISRALANSEKAEEAHIWG